MVTMRSDSRHSPACFAAVGLILLAAGACQAAADSPGQRDYKAIDDWALATPDSAKASIEGLARHLVVPAKDDFDKARALYRWLAANIRYDVQCYFGGAPTGGDPLRTGLSVCEGYSGMFERMAAVVDLPAATIPGWGKGYGWDPFQKMAVANHAWSAIEVDGRSYLLDPTWGAGYVDANRQYVDHFDPFYFLTPPEQFVYSHLPQDPRWQLLVEPITAQRFWAAVRPESVFFKMGLRLAEKRAVVPVTGPWRLDVGAPEGVRVIARVSSGGRALTPRPIEAERRGDLLSLNLTFPAPGLYEVAVFASRGERYGEYDSAIKYRVRANAPSY